MAVYRSVFEEKKTIYMYSASSNESKYKLYSLPEHQEDGIMTAHSMTQDVGSTLQAILAKLEKLNSVE